MSGFYKIFLKNKKARSSDSFSAIFNNQKKQKKLAQSSLVSSAQEIPSSEVSPLAHNSSKKVKMTILNHNGKQNSIG